MRWLLIYPANIVCSVGPMDIFRGFLVLGYLPKGIRSLLLSICMAGMCYELALQPKTPTFSGIPHCMNFTEPENNRTKMEKHVATPNPGKEWNAYHWKEFNKQNGLVLDALASSELQYEIIDG